MPGSAEEIGNYAFKATDELLFDANVWFFLYGPHRPGSPQAAAYSGALARILAVSCRVYTDVLIISEFVNRYARLRHQLLLQSRTGVPRDFKQFRATSAFKTIANDIAADTKRILSGCARVESGFAVLDFDALINSYGTGDSDFNDLVLTELCQSKGYMLVTDDGDFKGKNITVLTANRRLLP
ncbi:MAG TPA: PIN domain-containing protein [Candidatus Binatia bacterium]